MRGDEKRDLSRRVKKANDAGRVKSSQQVDELYSENASSSAMSLTDQLRLALIWKVRRACGIIAKRLPG